MLLFTHLRNIFLFSTLAHTVFGITTCTLRDNREESSISVQRVVDQNQNHTLITPSTPTLPTDSSGCSSEPNLTTSESLPPAYDTVSACSRDCNDCAHLPYYDQNMNTPTESRKNRFKRFFKKHRKTRYTAVTGALIVGSPLIVCGVTGAAVGLFFFSPLLLGQKFCCPLPACLKNKPVSLNTGNAPPNQSDVISNTHSPENTPMTER